MEAQTVESIDTDDVLQEIIAKFEAGEMTYQDYQEALLELGIEA